MIEPRCEAPIGVFDSGVGGLTVLRALRLALPSERLVYLGDTARVPYGTKGAATIVRYSANITHHLLAMDCKAVVIACNTASAFAADALTELTPHPVIDVINPVADLVASQPDVRRVGILGTRGTVRSQAYVRAIARRRPSMRVEQKACPLLVPLAEEGWVAGEVPSAVARRYLDEGFSKNGAPDRIVMGCTHYPLLRQTLENAAEDLWGNAPLFVDGAQATAERVKAELAQRNLLATDKEPGWTRVQVTDDPEGLESVAARFFGHAIAEVEHVALLNHS